MILANPASYVSLASFKNYPSDYDLTAYDDDAQTSLLVSATAKADAIMGKSYLLQERTIRYEGDGSNRIELHVSPICYVKKAQIVIPGVSGPLIPVDQILIDFESGSVLEYSPLYFQGQGYFARFPRNVPVDFTVGYGYGFTVAQPTWTSADAAGSGLTPGQYDIAVTAKTMWGETTATATAVTTATGNILLTIAPVLGAYLYRAYAAPHGTTPLKFVGESPLTTYGQTAVQIGINSLNAPTGQWQDTLPTTDTSANPIPTAIQEATRLLAMDILYSQNNLANRGIGKTQSDGKSVIWRSTEGNSGRGVSYTHQQALDLLAPYALRGIY